jgi:hypothetical protein
MGYFNFRLAIYEIVVLQSDRLSRLTSIMRDTVDNSKSQLDDEDNIKDTYRSRCRPFDIQLGICVTRTQLIAITFSGLIILRCELA